MPESLKAVDMGVAAAEAEYNTAVESSKQIVTAVLEVDQPGLPARAAPPKPKPLAVPKKGGSLAVGRYYPASRLRANICQFGFRELK